MTTTSRPAPTLLDGRQVPLGGVRGMGVTRWLPHRSLPTVGAWCFLDRMGPQRVDMRVLPHPHTGLQTVTWPLTGSVRHRDSLGSDVVVRPGELDLMTAGRGVAHSEVSLGDAPLLDALQLWVALPAALDGAPARFEQHADLPVVDLGGARATVVVGELAGASSPARVHTPLVGAEVVLGAGGRAEVPLETGFEHALLVLDGALTVTAGPATGAGDGGPGGADGADLVADLGVGPLLHLGAGRRDLVLSSDRGARAMLLGGQPYPDDLVMWWNFIGRRHEDVVAARTAWEERDDRFPAVAGHRGARIPAPPLPPVRLAPRRRREPLREVDHGAPAPAMS